MVQATQGLNQTVQNPSKEMAQVKMKVDHKQAKRRTKMSEDVTSGSASSEWEQMNMNPGQQ